jgi:metabotropic X receptor
MIPGVTIGAHILDDCDKDTYGLEMAVDFIKGRKVDCFRF